MIITMKKIIIMMTIIIMIMIINLTCCRDAEQGDQHDGGWRRRRQRRTGSKLWETKQSFSLCQFFSTCAVMDVGEPPLSSDNMSNCPLQVNMSWTSRWSRSKRCSWRSRRWWRRWAAPRPPTPPSSLPRTFPSLASIGRISEIEWWQLPTLQLIPNADILSPAENWSSYFSLNK